ncbi:hypothetical protein M408DRAFT_90893 [Serendipita vermifera MAFF 305830]|uniref:Uncharacterized protein n=1 Tax=Serendipita vermifera MAFF 305830 TaxID=933852 RepID=A0A0C2XZ51_SERVB|nr:hypothetical protein M408DRAFT_90893 [Serendipita vermifera MAFF 305830]
MPSVCQTQRGSLRGMWPDCTCPMCCRCSGKLRRSRAAPFVLPILTSQSCSGSLDTHSGKRLSSRVCSYSDSWKPVFHSTKTPAIGCDVFKLSQAHRKVIGWMETVKQITRTGVATITSRGRPFLLRISSPSGRNSDANSSYIWEPQITNFGLIIAKGGEDAQAFSTQFPERRSYR